jgi:hypothetical protein
VDTALPETLPFPLYHGTSTIWKDSILRYGLGGRKIVEELRALEFFREACARLDSMPEHLRPAGSQIVLDLIAKQGVSDAGVNFRHNSLYLTPNRKAALRYAQNSFGSELLTECHSLYKAIVAVGGTAAWLETYAELMAVFRASEKPLLVRVKQVYCRDLADETGAAPERKLNLLFNLIKEEEKRKKEVEELQRLAKEGDVEAAKTYFSRPRAAILTTEIITQEIGNAFNFESRAVYQASEIQLEIP